MTIVEFKQKLQSVLALGNAFTVQTFLGVKNGQGGITLKKANIRVDALSQLADLFRGAIQNEIIRIEADSEFDLINLSDGEDQSNVIYKFDLPDDPDFFVHISEADATHDADYFRGDRLFNFDEGDKFEDIAFFVHRVGSEDNHISIYRQNFAINVMHQGAGRLYFNKSETQIDTVKSDLMKMDSTIDVVKIDEEFFIINLRMLESGSSFEGVIRRRAESAIERINDFGILSTVEGLQDRLEELPFARKLMKALDSSPVLDMEVGVVLSFIQNKDKINRILKIENGKVVLGTKKSQDLFLRLLNDDLLHSELTTVDYSVGSKRKY